MKHLQICFFMLLVICISLIANAGITPDQVIQIQQKLLELGFDPGPVDGILGPKTIDVVKQYQTHRNIPATGKLDDKTIAALGLSLTIKTESPMRSGEKRSIRDQSLSAKPPGRQHPSESSILLSIPFRWYFVTGIILTMLSFIIVKRIERSNRQRGWGYFFAKNSLEFLIPFVAVSAFYSLLAISLSMFSNYMNLESLIWFENVLLKLKSIVDVLDFDPLTVLVILALLFILGLLRVGSHRLDMTSSALGRYQKITRRIYTIIVILCSFTLLGTYAGVPTNDFRVRIKTLRDGYSDVVRDIDRLVTHAAMNEILKNTKAQFPDTYTTALANSLTVEDRVSELARYYRSEKEKWNIEIASVDAIIRKMVPKPKVIIFRADSRTDRELDKKEQLRRRAPSGITLNRLEKLTSRVQASDRGVKQYFVELLKNKTGRKIVCEIPKVFTSEIGKSIIRQCAAKYPLLEPLVGVLGNTFHDKIQNDIEEATVRIADTGLKKPENTPRMIKAEAAKVAATHNPSVNKKNTIEAEALAQKIQLEFNEHTNLRAQVENEVKAVQSRQVNNLISSLKNPTPEIRASAARKLSQFGDVITKEDFNKIVDIMHHGKDESQKKLYRESHCTWYEYTQSKYYAAEALLTMKSPHVDNQIVAEAKQAKAKSRSRRRVSDPGWI